MSHTGRPCKKSLTAFYYVCGNNPVNDLHKSNQPRIETKLFVIFLKETKEKKIEIK